MIGGIVMADSGHFGWKPLYYRFQKDRKGCVLAGMFLVEP